MESFAGVPSPVRHIHISEITPEVFHESSGSTRPVVIAGALDSVEDWSLDLISESLDGREYPVRVYGDDYRSKPKREWKQYCTFRKLGVRQYVDLLQSRIAHRDGMYMAQIPFGETPLAQTLWDSIDQLQLKCHIRPASDLNLWLGPSGHTEALHFDASDGTLMQLHGAKHVTLYSPDQAINLYPFPRHRALPPHFSRVDTERPDFSRFPDFREALNKRFEVLLRQGEILFIPVRWWHEVRALGNAYVCSVNRFWNAKSGEANSS